MQPDSSLFSYTPSADGSRLATVPTLFSVLSAAKTGDALVDHVAHPIDATSLAAFNAARRAGSLSPAADRAIGAVLGMAVGDAVGAPVEFMPHTRDQRPITADGRTPLPGQAFLNAFGGKTGQWTDDASMGLCIADSLLAHGRLDPLDVALRFVAWWHGGYNNAFRLDTSRDDRASVGLGGMIGASMSAFMRDGRAATASGDKNSSGNGSIMRLSPVPVFFSSSRRAAAAAARTQSLITHAGEEARECAALMAAIIAKAIQTGGDDAALRKATVLDALGATKLISVPPDTDSVTRAAALAFDPAEIFCTTDVPAVAALARGDVLEKKPDGSDDPDRNWRWRADEYHYAPGRAAKQPGYIGSYAMDALAMALHCVASTDSFDAAVLKAANLRGDADSVASVTGQIAGAIYGASRIRREWVEDVERWDGGGTIAFRANRLFSSLESAGAASASASASAAIDAVPQREDGTEVNDSLLSGQTVVGGGGAGGGHAGAAVTLVIGGASVDGGGFNVAPRAACPHVAGAIQSGVGVPSALPGGCSECGDSSEVWRCLSCGIEGCSRFVAGHASAHATSLSHPVALGWSDLSVWCFACEDYLDVFKIKELRAGFSAAHVLRFGEKPPLPT
jgi:ADP-ribosylglycohydrolase